MCVCFPRPSSATDAPRRACAARVTLVGLCVCVCQCVQAAHPLLTQLQDQAIDIPTDSVSCWRASYNDFVLKIAIAFPYPERTIVGHFYTRNGQIFRIPSVYYAPDCTRAVNYTHMSNG